MKDLQFNILGSTSKKGETDKNISVKNRNFRNSVCPQAQIVTARVSSLSTYNVASTDVRKSNIGKYLEKNMELSNQENELLTLKNNYSKFEAKINYNRDVVRELEGDIKKEKNDLKEIFYLKKNFLINLLKQGFDSGFAFFYSYIVLLIKRFDEGISWIVRNLWAIGYEVKIGNLPEFLDAKAKEFILNVNGINKFYYFLLTFLESEIRKGSQRNGNDVQDKYRNIYGEFEKK